jgi:hypothetical protein
MSTYGWYEKSLQWSHNYQPVLTSVCSLLGQLALETNQFNNTHTLFTPPRIDLLCMKLGPFGRTCNPSKWEADIWGWLEVRRSALLHYLVKQRLHWACQQYGHSGGTRGWLGVEGCQLCMQDTSCSTKWHWQATVGHWVSQWSFIVCEVLQDDW